MNASFIAAPLSPTSNCYLIDLLTDLTHQNYTPVELMINLTSLCFALEKNHISNPVVWAKFDEKLNSFNYYQVCAILICRLPSIDLVDKTYMAKNFLNRDFKMAILDRLHNRVSQVTFSLENEKIYNMLKHLIWKDYSIYETISTKIDSLSEEMAVLNEKYCLLKKVNAITPSNNQDILNTKNLNKI